jgi:hypothetical protein
MFAQKFWLGLEWREEEEWLSPKQSKKMWDKETKPQWSSSLEIILMIQVALILWNMQAK